MTNSICIYCRTRIMNRLGRYSYLCRNCEATIRDAQSSEGFAYLDEN